MRRWRSDSHLRDAARSRAALMGFLCKSIVCGVGSGSAFRLENRQSNFSYPQAVIGNETLRRLTDRSRICETIVEVRRSFPARRCGKSDSRMCELATVEETCGAGEVIRICAIQQVAGCADEDFCINQPRAARTARRRGLCARGCIEHFGLREQRETALTSHGNVIY